ncbi:MAG: hypothetical protein J6W60_00650 [Treponema sp.]|nr:hypothetical protein [Treponema sp.]
MADINKTINDLEKFRKELFEMHEWWEESIVSSALALLKEQQPRVLTLLEVINHFSIPYDISKDIGKEFDYQQEIEPLYFDFPMDDIDPYIVHWRGYSQVSKYLDVWKNDYGKSWRVWSAKPTKEQRKAVPWETH